MSSYKEVGRLAFRIEGNNWTAYWALPDTLKDAVFLGAISMALAQNPARKDAFQALIRDGVADLMEELYGERPDIVTRPAPESERSGNC
jgi:hypothetical protein